MEFHKHWIRTIEELPWILLAELIIDKLGEKGVKVTKREKTKLITELQKGHFNKLSVGKWRLWDRRQISIELTAEEVENIDTHISKFMEEMPERTIEMIDEISPSIVESLLRNVDKDVKDQKRSADKFNRHLWETWGEPFTLLRLMIDLAHRAGENAIALSNMEDEEISDTKEVILRLQARGVQVAREIMTLMESGFADGATARWRTLHEIAIISSFISDREEECATRYIDHDIVSRYKYASAYQEFCKKYGYDPIPDEEYADIEQAYYECRREYDEDFVKDYGWAAPFLRKKRCTFRDIVESAPTNNLQLYYKYACEAVHAGPRGIFEKVGLMNEDIILFNASDYGFADVGRNTALTLTLLTSQLLTHCLVLDMMISGFVLNLLSTKAGNSFYSIQEKMINDSRSIN